jgi:hypothetical protein
MALPRIGPLTTDLVPPERRFRRLGAVADRLLRAAVLVRKAAAAPPYRIVLAARLAGQQPFLAEWLVFHRGNGVDHFYLFDAGLTSDRHAWLSARSDCTVMSWPDPRRDIFRRAQQLTAAAAEWLIVLHDSLYLYGIERPLNEILPAYAGYPALTLNAVLFGTFAAEPPAGVPLTEHYVERAQAVNGVAERELDRLRGSALLWNQRYDLRRPLAAVVRGYLPRAALLLGGVQLNQYLNGPEFAGEGLAVLLKTQPPALLLTSRGPHDDSAAAYSPAVRKALGLRGATHREPQRAVAARLPLPTAAREIVVIGMQHGGLQPVIRWLLSGLPEPWVYLHNQAPGRPAFRFERATAAAEGVSAEQQLQLADARQRQHFGGRLVHSYLDVETARLAEVLHDNEPLLGQSAQRLVLLVVRDPINLYAARLQRTRRRGWRGQLPAQGAGVSLLRQCWNSHAAEFLAAESQLPHCLPLHFGRFMTDGGYRDQLAAQLGVVAAAARPWPGQLLQAPQNEEDGVERLFGSDWQTRWRGLEADSEFLAFFADPELQRLQAEYLACCPSLQATLQPFLTARSDAALETT